MNPVPALIELVVADMAATLSFYRALGLDIPEGAESEPHVDAAFGGMRIAFDTHDVVLSFDPGWTPAHGGHRVALAFACGSPAEVDDVYRRMVEGGAEGHLDPWDAFWGMRYAVLHDPDGNPIDLFADLG